MARITLTGALLSIIAAAIIGAALGEGLHNERVCARTANPALCTLAFDAGENEGEAIRQGALR